MSDHELDRRINDQSFKLNITKELTEVRIELKNNTVTTDKIEKHVEEIDKTLKGTGRLDQGLVGQTLDNAVEIERLTHFIKRWLPWVAIAVVVFADQISPILRDYLFQKTHLNIFRSVEKEFIEKKSKANVTHYHITYNVAPDEKTK